MIIKVVESPRRSKFSKHYVPADYTARVVIALTRRESLDEQDLVYLKKLGIETEVVTHKE